MDGAVHGGIDGVAATIRVGLGILNVGLETAGVGFVETDVAGGCGSWVTDGAAAWAIGAEREGELLDVRAVVVAGVNELTGAPIAEPSSGVEQAAVSTPATIATTTLTGFPMAVEIRCPDACKATGERFVHRLCVGSLPRRPDHPRDVVMVTSSTG